jgi:tungstate transport system ATP-binding protein
MNQPCCYRLNDVGKEYGGREVLHITRLEVLRGEVLCLVGPTGSGKSTLLRLLSALEPPTRGDLYFEQYRLDSHSLPLAVQRRMAMLFQRPLLLSGTVRANIEYGLRLRGMRRQASKLEELLNALRLWPIASQSARTLSVGQTQLVALARALVLEADVLLLDEPTANLDPAHVALVEEVIENVRRRRPTTVVWATHNMFQARRMARRVGLLLEGQLVEVAQTETFFDAPKDARAAAFVQGKMVY